MEISRPSVERCKELAKELPKLTRKAAIALAEANIVLLATGAGFSADSGLAVYKDIAAVPAYQKLGLEYHDICQPHWLASEPSLFYGFWGMCFNDYRNTEPHEGYQIVKSWRDDLLSSNHWAQEIRALWEKDFDFSSKDSLLNHRGGGSYRDLDAENSTRNRREMVEKTNRISTAETAGEKRKAPGAFFSLTSNVDEHFKKSGFHSGEVREVHGHTEVWQCGESCTEATWRAPIGYRFKLTEDLLAPEGFPAENAMSDATSDATSEGDTRARHGFEATNHPRCIHCGQAARPAILMFGDAKWIDDDQQEASYSQWERIVASMAQGDSECKVVILEIGCGNRVPTIRYMTESLLAELPTKQATLIRVNPDFPLVDNEEDLASHNVIPLLDTGLSAIRNIDRLMKEMRSPVVLSPTLEE